MRDAPSIAIVQTLIDAGAEVYAHDPEGMEEAAKAGFDYYSVGR